MSSLPATKRRKKNNIIRAGDAEAAHTVIVTTTKDRKGRTKLVKTPANAFLPGDTIQPTPGSSSHQDIAGTEESNPFLQDEHHFQHNPDPDPVPAATRHSRKNNV